MSVRHIKLKYARLQLHTEDILHIFDKKETANRLEACKLTARKMRKNLKNYHPSSPGDLPAMYSKNLLKGVGYKLHAYSKYYDSYMSEVGNYSPHAHLLEFGHGDGTLRGKTKRPYFERTFKEVEEKLVKIMSQEYF